MLGYESREFPVDKTFRFLLIVHFSGIIMVCSRSNRIVCIQKKGGIPLGVRFSNLIIFYKRTRYGKEGSNYFGIFSNINQNYKKTATGNRFSVSSAAQDNL